MAICDNCGCVTLDEACLWCDDTDTGVVVPVLHTHVHNSAPHEGAESPDEEIGGEG